MFKKMLLTALAVVGFTIFPIIETSAQLATVHAAARPTANPPCINGATPVGFVTIGAYTFPTGCYGCTGPTIGVYGSSALKNFINASAQQYCNSFTTRSTAPDVEYLSGGDSCPGVDFAADTTSGNALGAADVFAGACTGTQARPASKISDGNISVNIVEALANCQGSTAPQGTGTAHDCTGTGNVGTLYSFVAPNDMSKTQAQNLWNTSVGDYGQVGGVAGQTPVIQQRTSGSGTRATWCLYIYDGTDNCLNNSSAGQASGTSTELNDVCGPLGGGSAPDGVAGIGYATRAAVVSDPRVSGSTATVLTGCGIVALEGFNAYNGVCNPTSSSNPPGSFTQDPYDGVNECNGDWQVAQTQYSVWGYEHLDVNAASTTNAAAKAYVSFVQNNANQQDLLLQQQGFMRNCQMLWVRSADGAPPAPSPIAPTC